MYVPGNASYATVGMAMTGNPLYGYVLEEHRNLQLHIIFSRF